MMGYAAGHRTTREFLEGRKVEDALESWRRRVNELTFEGSTPVDGHPSRPRWGHSSPTLRTTRDPCCPIQPGDE